MKFIEPKVFLVAETKTTEGMQDYLDYVDAGEWKSDAKSDVELLPEFMGRICYRSWKPGLNANVTKVRDGNKEYLENIINVAHGSVTEHSWVSFVFADVSRVFTHELVRHRVGVAISQESLRYVRLDNLKIWMPTIFQQHGEVARRARQLIMQMEDFQRFVSEYFNLDHPDVKFDLKKEVTSAARRFAGMGIGTGIGWSADIRTIRHVLEVRTSPHAEEEIRIVFGKVGFLMMQKYPNLFNDYEVELVKGHPYFKTRNSKI